MRSETTRPPARPGWRDGLLAVGFLGVFAAITAALAVDGPLIDLDLAVYEWAEANRPAAADLAARGFSLLGQGFWLMLISFVLAGWLGLRQRRATGGGWRTVWPPVVYVFTATVLLVPTVLLLKAVTERGAPSSRLPAEQTVALFGPLPPGEYAAGYPGGHAVNTIVWYGVILLLVTALLRTYGRGEPPPLVRVAFRVAPPVIVVAASTYLSWHWLTDGLAGLALGLAIDRLLAVLRPALWAETPPAPATAPAPGAVTP